MALYRAKDMCHGWVDYHCSDVYVLFDSGGISRQNLDVHVKLSSIIQRR